MNHNECPECHQDDTDEAGWTPMMGPVRECNDCGHVWSPEVDLPWPTD